MTTKPPLSDEMRKMVGPPQFHKSVMYAYNKRAHAFYFYTNTGQGRELTPIAMFSPIYAEDIPYDPQAIVELIADTISREEGSYDFDIDDSE